MTDTKLRIAFVWFWNRASEISPYWRDGYTAVVEEVGKKHDVDVYMDEQLPGDGYDFYWLWGDSNCPAIDKVAGFSGRKGISLTTDPSNFDNLRKLDVVFVESDPVYEQVRSQGIRTIKAFGTDTEFFYPNPEIKKDLEYFYPATFSPWKKQSDIAHLGSKLLCVGTIQPDGDKEYQACLDNGVQLEVGYFPAKQIRDYYWRTQQMTIPAIHGSERTVLECMAMNIPVAVTNSVNKRAASFMEEYKKSNYETPRDFVLAHYSHEKFAEEILKGIENG